MQPRFRNANEHINWLQSKVKQLEKERSEERTHRWHTLSYMAIVSLDMMTKFMKQFEEDELGECVNITKLTLEHFHKYIMQYINIDRERGI